MIVVSQVKIISNKKQLNEEIPTEFVSMKVKVEDIKSDPIIENRPNQVDDLLNEIVKQHDRN